MTWVIFLFFYPRYGTVSGIVPTTACYGRFLAAWFSLARAMRGSCAVPAVAGDTDGFSCSSIWQGANQFNTQRVLTRVIKDNFNNIEITYFIIGFPFFIIEIKYIYRDEEEDNGMLFY